MNKADAMREIRACLSAADTADTGDVLSEEQGLRALAGYALREVASTAAPYVGPTRLAWSMLSKFRAKP